MFISLRTKITMTIICFLTVILLIMNGMLYYLISKYSANHLYETSMNWLRIAEQVMDKDDIEEFIMTKDKNGSGYMTAKKKLVRVNQLCKVGTLFVFEIVDDRLVYLFDGLEDYSQVKYPFDLINIDVDQINKKDWYIPKSVNEMLGEKYSMTLIPIANYNEETIGAIGYIFDQQKLSNKLRILKLVIGLSLCVIVLTVIMGCYIVLTYFLKPIEQLMANIKQMIDGNFKLKLDVKRKDELGEINRQLVEDCSHMEQVIGDINASKEKLKSIAGRIVIDVTNSLEAYEELANSTREISLISYEQLEKRVSIRQVIAKLEEEVSLAKCRMESYMNNSEVQGVPFSVNRKVIEQISEHIYVINNKTDALDKVFALIDDHTVNLAAITEEQMASSEEFAAMAELLSKEIKRLDELVGKLMV